MNRHNILYTITILFTVLSCISCAKGNTDIPMEDLSSFILPKPAESVPHEAGIPFQCFPKQPGDLGFSFNENISIGNYKEKYQVTLSIDIMANYYGSFDKQNLSIVILQYLDENNVMKIDTIMDGRNVIEKDKRGRFRSYFSDVEPIKITKQSGDPVYFAVFYSPYAYFDMSINSIIETDDNSEIFPEMNHRYSKTMESFHISEIGKNYIIYSLAMYLP